MTVEQFDRQHALGRIDECKRVAADRNTLTVNTDHTTYRLGQLLDEIAGGRYAEQCFGMPFGEYIEQHFKDERGVPRTHDWARGLAHQYRTIAPWPALVQKLAETPRPGQPYISFNSAFFTAKLADVDDWKKKADHAAQDEVDGDEPEDFVKRTELADQYLDQWLIESALRTCSAIRSDLADVRKAQEGSPKSPVDDWPFVGGKLDPSVKAHGDEVVTSICSLEHDGPMPDDLSFVQHYERLVIFSDDCLTAFKAVLAGDQGPLTSLIETVKNASEPS